MLEMLKGKARNNKLTSLFLDQIFLKTDLKIDQMGMGHIKKMYL